MSEIQETALPHPAVFGVISTSSHNHNSVHKSEAANWVACPAMLEHGFLQLILQLKIPTDLLFSGYTLLRQYGNTVLFLLVPADM